MCTGISDVTLYTKTLQHLNKVLKYIFIEKVKMFILPLFVFFFLFFFFPSHFLLSIWQAPSPLTTPVAALAPAHVCRPPSLWAPAASRFLLPTRAPACASVERLAVLTPSKGGKSWQARWRSVITFPFDEFGLNLSGYSGRYGKKKRKERKEKRSQTWSKLEKFECQTIWKCQMTFKS